jgi:hypothetical protein
MSSYPEKIPNSLTPVNSFYFNLESSREVKKQLESQISNLNDRIDKIVDHFTVQDIPIIRLILNASEDREELKKLSKALDRIADLIDARNQLLPKLEVIKVAEKDPNWFAWTFGDFAADIDNDIENIMNGESDV